MRLDGIIAAAVQICESEWCLYRKIIDLCLKTLDLKEHAEPVLL